MMEMTLVAERTAKDDTIYRSNNFFAQLMQ